MITIKRESLLFRLATYGAYSPFNFDPYWVNKENLCPFMRQVFMGLIYCAALATLIAAEITGIPLFILIELYDFPPMETANLWLFFSGMLGGVTLLFGVIVGTLFASAGLGIGIGKVNSTASIVNEYLKAKHNKYCPPIKVE